MTTRIIWADQERESTANAAKYLAERGFDVVTVSDGVDCMTQLKARTADVVIVDEGLLWGGVDGVLDWMNDRSRASHAPYVLLTGHESPETVGQRFGVLPAHCLQKPIQPQAIIDNLQSNAVTNAQ